MSRILIKNSSLVNEGRIIHADVLIKGDRIEKIASSVSDDHARIIDADGKYLIPGVIDDQVHFREPGLTHKADIYSESRAAAAGGVTSFMEMPNTVPNALTQSLLADKYEIASRNSLVNYSFFMGASNDNLSEVLRTDAENVCGVKVFMGSSTGNMLVDDATVLDKLFRNCPMLIATHCEYEPRIRQRTAQYLEKYGDDIPVSCHPEIRDEEACFLSSSMAVGLARKYNTRLHILHISTSEELSLFDNNLPVEKKRITAEVCVHHLHFTANDYERLGTLIKCNPAIKDARHKPELWKALLDNRLDIIATDHAPHLLSEKQNLYQKSPSGLPLVQHSLQLMMDYVKQGTLSIDRMVEKMCHAPAKCFNIAERGFIREGYFADLVLIDTRKDHTVSKDNILYKCGWSPLEGHSFSTSVSHTIVNGNLVFEEGKLLEGQSGQRLRFNVSA